MKHGILNDRLSGKDLVLVAPHPVIEVDGRSVRSGSARYRAGAEVRAYLTDGTPLSRTEEDVLEDTEGRSFRLTEDALIGPDGVRAERIAGHLSYWFAWIAYHPKTQVYEETARP